MMTTVGSAIVRKAADAVTRRWRLVAEDLGPLVQQTGAATVAWLIARRLIDHHDPFFAPISAFVSLNTSLGERGLNTLRLLQGVVLGIGVGELTLAVLRGGYGSLALGTFVALVLARALGGARVIRAQAALGAILTISSGNGEVGTQRLTDALIGAGVALVFSQLLFSPEPLRLLRRVETRALTAMAAGLDLTARALEGEEAVADEAIGSQRQLRDELSELARIRRASGRIARHSLVWRKQISPLVRENEDAGFLDLLGGSCLLLTRTSLNAREEDRRLLAPGVRALSTTLADLARQPGDRAARQEAVDRSLEILREMRAATRQPDPEMAAALTAGRMAVTDLMLFVGVDPDEARAATREERRHEQALEASGGAPTRKPRLHRLRRSLRQRLRFDRLRRRVRRLLRFRR
jgi:uncharacterized membrane protein YgaE (UPF0421/DUF939 family)